jgi:hypothetical protein
MELIRFAELQYFSGYTLAIFGAADGPAAVITFVVDPSYSVDDD